MSDEKVIYLRKKTTTREKKLDSIVRNWRRVCLHQQEQLKNEQIKLLREMAKEHGVRFEDLAKTVQSFGWW